MTKREFTPHGEEYLDALEKRIDAHNANVAARQEIDAYLKDARTAILRQPIPRDQCAGCFSAIYDGAAAQGWCCDCYPQRHKYEKEVYGY